MFDFLEGTITARRPGVLVLDVNGVGYRLDISLSTYEALPPSGSARIHTWLKVAESELRLFGFATERERDLFLRLVGSVKNLGPAKALSLISHAGVEGLVRSIEEGDAARLRLVKGIGPQMANRLVVELKGKLPDSVAGVAGADASSSMDAVAALQNLGYDRNEAQDAVRRAASGLPKDAPLEDLLKRSLENV
jgi:Holliday junction DNA helicase RuvA